MTLTGDFDDEYFPETKDYRSGTAIVYRSPKKQKIHQPKYGYKFIDTNKPSKRLKKKP